MVSFSIAFPLVVKVRKIQSRDLEQRYISWCSWLTSVPYQLVLNWKYLYDRLKVEMVWLHGQQSACRIVCKETGLTSS